MTLRELVTGMLELFFFQVCFLTGLDSVIKVDLTAIRFVRSLAFYSANLGSAILSLKAFFFTDGISKQFRICNYIVRSARITLMGFTS